MSLKSEIKKAITLHSKKYNAKRVWKIEVDEYMDESCVMWIEVSVTKKKKTKHEKKKSIPPNKR